MPLTVEQRLTLQEGRTIRDCYCYTNVYWQENGNGFGWNRLPKSFMAENTAFLLLTALIHNFYETIMSRLDTKAFGLRKTSRIKAFVFRFVSVPAKWILTARQYVLNIYTEKRAYARPFSTESS